MLTNEPNVPQSPYSTIRHQSCEHEAKQLTGSSFRLLYKPAELVICHGLKKVGIKIRQQ